MVSTCRDCQKILLKGFVVLSFCFISLCQPRDMAFAQDVISIMKREVSAAGYFYGVYYRNTVGLKKFCAGSYVPHKYINQFNQKYDKQIQYSSSLIQYYVKQKLSNIDSVLADVLQADYKQYQKEFPAVNKTEYCQHYEADASSLLLRTDMELEKNPWKWPDTITENEVVKYKTNKLRFSSKGLPKSVGHEIEIQYPKSWEAREPIRAHVVAKYVEPSKDNGITMRMLVFMITPIGESVTREQAETTFKTFDRDVVKEFFPANAEIIDGASTKYDGEPGFWVTFKSTEERAGIPMVLYTLGHAVVYDDVMIWEQLMVGGMEPFEWFVKERFKASIPLFMAMGNDLVIHDKYRTPVEQQLYEQAQQNSLDNGTSASAKPLPGEILFIISIFLALLLAVFIIYQEHRKKK